jgi:hypothetical protein
MKSSELTADLYAAFAAMQGELKPALKESDNPFFKSRYADFAACKATAQQAMAKNGLAAIQGILTDIERGLIGVETRIVHKSGQWIESDSWCKPKAMLPQDVGSAVTYLKRYALSAMIGIVADEDDDANQAQGKNEQPKKEQPKQQQKPIPNTQLSSDFYTGTSVQEKAVAEILCKHGVPDQDFELIHQELMNKPKKFLFDVILKRYEAR